MLKIKRQLENKTPGSGQEGAYSLLLNSSQ